MSALRQLAADLRRYHDGGTLSLAAIDAMIADVDAAIEAEARDATGLREALDAHQPTTNAPGIEWCSCGWRPTAPIQWGRGAWGDHREQAVRTALAAAPPEPRWPSRDDRLLVTVEWMEKAHGVELHEHYPLGWANVLHALAALREGAERP